MDAKAHRLKRGLGKAVFFVVFLLVFVLADWLVYAASFGIFRYDSAAVPANFYIVVSAGERYRPVSWEHHSRAMTEYGARTFLLPQAQGSIPGKATFAFAVLEDDGERQLIEVSFEGPYSSTSRYEAYKDRVRPIAYRSLTWGDARQGHFAVFLAVVALAAIVALGAALGVRHLALKRLAQ